MPSNPRSLRSKISATNHRLLLERRLKKHLETYKGTVLVVGAGHDPYRSYLKKATKIITNDIDPKLPNIDIVSNADQIPMADNSVDVILSIEVFEHVEDLTACISECNRLLKPGGILYVTMPFLFHIHGDPHDYRRLTVQGISQELKPNFNIVYNEYFGNLVNVFFDSISSITQILSILRPFFRLGTMIDLTSKRFPSGLIVIAQKK